MAAAETLSLERVIGISALHSTSFVASGATGDLAYPAGSVVVLYSPARDEQVRYFRATKAIACLAFSRCGRFLAVGERGKAPRVIVWDLDGGASPAELGGHKYGVSCVAFGGGSGSTQDLLATVGFKHDRQVCLWAWADGTLLATARVTQKIYAVAFHLDGNLFVTAGDRHVKFWSLAENRTAPETEAAEAASPDATLPTALAGQPASILEDHRDATFVDIVFGGEGATRDNVYAVTDGGVLVHFSARRKKVEQWVNLHTSRAYGLSRSQDASRLAIACADGAVRVFSTATLQYLLTLPPPPPVRHYPSALHPQLFQPLEPDPAAKLQYPAALAVALDADGTCLAALYGDRSILLWTLEAGVDGAKPQPRLARVLPHHHGAIWDVAFLPETIQLKDATRHPPANAVAIAAGDVGGFKAEESLPKGAMVTCSNDGTLRLWNLLATTSSPPSSPAAPSPSPLPFLLHVLDANPGATPPAPTAESKDPGPSPGELLSRSVGVILDTATDPEIPPHPDASRAPRCLSLRPDGRAAVLGDKEGNLRFYDLSALAHRGEIAAHDAEVLSVSHAPKRVDLGGDAGSWLLASGGRDRLVHVFAAAATKSGDPGKGHDDKKHEAPVGSAIALPRLVGSATPHQGAVTEVAFSKDAARLLSVGSDGALQVSGLRAGTGDALCLERGGGGGAAGRGSLHGVATDASGRYCVTAGQDKILRIHNVRNGRLVRQYKPEKGEGGGRGGTLRVGIDPSGLYLATCAYDRWVRIVDFYSGRVVARAAGHGDMVTAAEFTPDGQNLVTVGADGIIFSWKLPREVRRAVAERLQELVVSKGTEADVVSLRPKPEEKVGDDADEGDDDGDTEKAEDAKDPETVEEDQPREGDAAASADEAEEVRLRLRKSAVPAWAATGHAKAAKGEEGGPSPPKRPGGRWAERMDDAGYALFGAYPVAMDDPRQRPTWTLETAPPKSPTGSPGPDASVDAAGILHAAEKGVPALDPMPASVSPDPAPTSRSSDEEADAGDAEAVAFLKRVRQSQEWVGAGLGVGGALAADLQQDIRKSLSQSYRIAHPPPGASAAASETSAFRSLQEERELRKQQEQATSPPPPTSPSQADGAVSPAEAGVVSPNSKLALQRDATEAALTEMRSNLKNLGILAGTLPSAPPPAPQEAAAPATPHQQSPPPPDAVAPSQASPEQPLPVPDTPETTPPLEEEAPLAVRAADAVPTPSLGDTGSIIPSQVATCEVDSPTAAISRSPPAPQPLAVYHAALQDLQAAALRAVDLYAELRPSDGPDPRTSLTEGFSSALARLSLPTTEGIATEPIPPREALLESFQTSFESLRCSFDNLAVPRAEMTLAPVEDSAAGSVDLEASLPQVDALLERYSERLLQAFSRKLDSSMGSGALQFALDREDSLSINEPSRDEDVSPGQQEARQGAGGSGSEIEVEGRDE